VVLVLYLISLCLYILYYFVPCILRNAKIINYNYNYNYNIGKSPSLLSCSKKSRG
jgi:hypothetical protein